MASVASCADSRCESVQVVVSSDGHEPGTIRAGALVSGARAGIAALSDGKLVCPTCSGFAVLNSELEEQYTAGAPSSDLAVGPDDTIYITDASGNELSAFEPDGALRWKQTLVDSDRGRLVVGTDGVYVETAGRPGNQFTLVFFSATDGQRRTLALASQPLLAANRDSLFTASSISGAPTSAATIRRLDTTGATQWERKWIAGSESLGIVISSAVTTPQGGLIVAGGAPSGLDFGDRTLSGADGPAFLVGLDASGATQWAYALPSIEGPRAALEAPTYLALTPSGNILLAGPLFSGHLDTYLAVATSTGVIRAHRIGGVAEQLARGLASGGDDLAWLAVGNRALDDSKYAEIDLAGRELHEPGTYVLAIVP